MSSLSAVQAMSRIELDDHLVAVAGLEDRRDLVGAEAVVERSSELVGGDAERAALSRSTTTRRLQGIVLEVGGDVGEARGRGPSRRRACSAQPSSSSRSSPARRTGTGSSTSTPPRLRFCTGTMKLAMPGIRAERAAQVGEDRLERRPLALRLQLDEEAALVGGRRAAAAADDRGDMRHVGLRAQRLDDLLLQRQHGGERDVLARLGRDRELADVLLREEALRDVDEQPDGGRRPCRGRRGGPAAAPCRQRSSSTA